MRRREEPVACPSPSPRPLVVAVERVVERPVVRKGDGRQGNVRAVVPPPDSDGLGWPNADSTPQAAARVPKQSCDEDTDSRTSWTSGSATRSR
jgi:hypothetical protein